MWTYKQIQGKSVRDFHYLNEACKEPDRKQSMYLKIKRVAVEIKSTGWKNISLFIFRTPPPLPRPQNLALLIDSHPGKHS